MQRLTLTDRLKSCVRNNPFETFSFTVSMSLVTGILWYFHDRFWWPMDEGVYAYVAQRILAGDVIHRDLVDLHAGLGNFINAAAFALFGEDLLSLRYPLAVLSIIQSGLAFWIMKERGWLIAGLSGLLVASTGFIQFPIGGAQWYALFLVFLTVFLATQLNPTTSRNLLIFGALIGACFLIRQLSGAILAMGLITWLLLVWDNASARPSETKAISGKLLAGLIMLGVVLYLFSKMSITAVLFSGMWVLLISVLAVRRVNLPIRIIAPRLAIMLGGCLIVAMPMIIYFTLNGALVDWLRDVLITPFYIHGQDYIRDISYGAMFIASTIFLFAEPGINTTLSATGWLAALLILPATGFACVQYLEKLGPGERVHPLPVIAAFWSILTMHYQIPHYFFSAFPLVFCAMIWIYPRQWLVYLMAILTAWALWYQAAQPVSRMMRGDIIGIRVTYEDRSTLPKVNLRIEPEDEVIFSELIDRIESEAGPDEPIFSLPGEPEINFMTERRVPGWFYMIPTGVKNEEELDRAIEMLRDEAPFFVVNRRVSNSHSDISALILDEIELGSDEPEIIGPFDLYRYHGLEYSRSPDE